MIQNIIEKRITDVANENKLLSGRRKKCVFINTNVDDKASAIYIKNKTNVLEQYNIKCIEKYLDSFGSKYADFMKLLSLIDELNEDSSIDAIVLQLPLRDNLKEYEQELLNRIDKQKDVDRLNLAWGLSANKIDLPITAEVIFDILEAHIHSYSLTAPKIYLRGLGRLVNKPLLMQLLRKYGNIRLCNSKTSDVIDNENCKWADIIVSATGKANTLKINNKAIISPTIEKIGNVWANDIVIGCENNTHKVLGSIGKLTCLYLANRCLNL